MSLKSLFVGVAFAALSLGLAHAETRIDPARLSGHIKVLASDAFEGRGPGTAGEVKSLDYISHAFQGAGLTPAGDAGGWTQALTLRSFQPVGDIKVSLNGRRLASLDDVVVRTLLPVKHVSIKDAPLVFVGYGVSAPEKRWDDYKGVDLHGKIAVVLVNDPDFEMAPGDPLNGLFDGKAETYYGRWTYKYEEAARRGALGVLVVHETSPAAYGWLTVRNSNSNPQFDTLREHPEAAHTLMEGWIQRPVAVDMFKAAGLDFEAQKDLARTRGFKPVELNGQHLSADYDVETKSVVTHNVIGKLAGATHPDEAVLFGAHWDHLGVGAPDATGDKIYHGAVDNASGVAGVIELARAFAAAPRTQRSLIFIAFTSEEKNLLGSEYYAEHPVVPLGKTVALLNIDVMNLHGAARDISDRGPGKADLDRMLAKEAEREGRRFTVDPEQAEGSFFRADHFSFAKFGVPAITLTGGQDFVNGGLAAGEAAHKEYIAHHYHQPADVWSADFNYDGAVADLATYYALGRELADSRVWPGWEAGSQFKAARDASAGERR